MHRHWCGSASPAVNCLPTTPIQVMSLTAQTPWTSRWSSLPSPPRPPPFPRSTCRRREHQQQQQQLSAATSLSALLVRCITAQMPLPLTETALGPAMATTTLVQSCACQAAQRQPRTRVTAAHTTTRAPPAKTRRTRVCSTSRTRAYLWLPYRTISSDGNRVNCGSINRPLPLHLPLQLCMRVTGPEVDIQNLITRPRCAKPTQRTRCSRSQRC